MVARGVRPEQRVSKLERAACEFGFGVDAMGRT